MMGMTVVLVGNPVDGVAVYGPFTTGEDAFAWADAERLDEWWPVSLTAPDGGVTA